jgi:hypothetical protein
MADTITLPGGLHIKKNVAIAIGIGAAGIAGYVLYKQSQASSTTTDTSGYSTADVDPQTGYPYGSPEDQAALAALSAGTLGQVNSAGYVGGSVIGYDQYGNPIYNQGQGGGITGTGGFTNNAQWTQAAEALMGSTGADAIAAALGKYLLGQPLTDEQVTAVQQAIASEGFPPVPGPEGFPPSYHTAQPPSGGTGGGGVAAKNPVKGLKADPRFTQIDVHWNALPNATKYLVKLHDGSKIAQQQTIAGTFTTFHNVKRNHSYRITVWGQPGTGATASVNARTQK